MLNRYTLKAKRPHENVFTEWLSTYDYEVVERNIKIIESYGWQWKLKEDDNLSKRERRLLERLRMSEMRLKRLMECQE